VTDTASPFTRQAIDAQLAAIVRGESHRHRKVIFMFQQQFLEGAAWAARILEDEWAQTAIEAAHHRLSVEFYDE